MELYLSACSKAANVAATKTAASGLAAASQQCGNVSVSEDRSSLSSTRPQAWWARWWGGAADGHVRSLWTITVQLLAPSCGAAGGRALAALAATGRGAVGGSW